MLISSYPLLGGEYHENHHLYPGVAGVCAVHGDGNGCFCAYAAGRSVRFRQSELLKSRPARVVIGAAVFTLGILAGAGIAAWLVPPV
jgi:hypothetical protein